MPVNYDNLGSQLRLDANETLIATVESLKHIETNVYARKYPALLAATFIPQDPSLEYWMNTTEFYESDHAGEADIIAPAAEDVPNISMTITSQAKNIRPVGAKWTWTLMDIERAQRTGIPLESMHAEKVREAVERKIDRIQAVGDAPWNMTGMTNHPNVALTTPANYTGAWLTGPKTFAQVLTDLNAIYVAYKGVIGDTDGLDADYFLLPVSQYVHAATVNSGATDETALNVFAKNIGFNRANIRPWSRLATAGAGGVTRALMYRNHPDILIHKSSGFDFLDPHRKTNLLFEQAGMRVTAGVDVRYAPGLMYVDGV